MTRARAVAAVVFLVLAGLALGTGSAAGDGKFYRSSEHPVPGEPFQRAILDFHDGREVLLIQPHLVGQGRLFGWVIPVPAVPSLEDVSAYEAERVFDALERATAPGRVYVSLAVGMVGALLFFIFSPLFLVAAVHRLVHLRRPAQRIGRHWSRFLLAAVSGLALVALFARGGPTKSRGVAVVSEQRVGIYETKVIAASDARALQAWLHANGFQFDAADDTAFASYVARGWRFVTARIAAGESERARFDGLLPPLVLTFATPRPVYPFALSATSGRVTKIVLYVHAASVAAHRVLIEEGSVSDSDLHGWAEVHSWLRELALIGGAAQPDSDAAPSVGVLTHLSGSLAAENFDQDLVLELEPARRPERRLVWSW